MEILFLIVAFFVGFNLCRLTVDMLTRHTVHNIPTRTKLSYATAVLGLFVWWVLFL